jgi:hypothetical protein
MRLLTVIDGTGCGTAQLDGFMVLSVTERARPARNRPGDDCISDGCSDCGLQAECRDRVRVDDYFAVIRVDLPLASHDPNDLRNRITIREGLPTVDEAMHEVDRLNALNGGERHVYIWNKATVLLRGVASSRHRERWRSQEGSATVRRRGPR